MSVMSFEEHRAFHKELHDSLDVLLADFIIHTEKRPSEATIMELLEWSYQQTTMPTNKE